MSTDFLGVEFVPEQMAYRIELSLPNGQKYEDYFGDDESAALVSELVVLTHGPGAPTTSTSTTRSVATRLSVMPIPYSTKRQLGWAGLHEQGVHRIGAGSVPVA